jgi:hypothetical protein
MEKPLAAAAGLGWQGKHTNLLGANWATGSSWARSSPRSSCPRMTPEARALRLLHCLSGHLPDRRLSRAFPAGCAALHLLPDDRACRPGRPGTAPGAGQPHLWLRRLPGRLPLEQVRTRRRRGALRRPNRPDRPRPGRAGRARRCRLSRPLRRLADQADRARPLRAQRALCHRQFGQPAAGRRRALLEDPDPAVAEPRAGRWPGWLPEPPRPVALRPRGAAIASRFTNFS